MSNVAEARREQHLGKLYRWPDGKIESMRDRVAAMVATGQARITYRPGTGRKVGGTRLPSRPQWVLWVGDHGVDITKIAAEFAAGMMSPSPSVGDLEREGNAAYEKARREAASW